ncbi:VOC family protein [Streptomyces caniferus]|uniref:VOC family protein n=1 Tax=Streptomyces caniferus TaxID=285557 RepID=UPI00345459D6
MRLLSLTSDCPDPESVAAFHQRATGLELHGESHADVAGLGRPDRLFVGFQWVHDHQPPRWPDLTGQQQAHLDFSSISAEVLSDVDSRASAHCLPLPQGERPPEGRVVCVSAGSSMA